MKSIRSVKYRIYKDYIADFHQNLPVYIRFGLKTLNHERFIDPSIRIKMIRDFLRLFNDTKLICSIPENLVKIGIDQIYIK